MTDAECKAIIEAKRQNPTYTYRELAKKFKRSNSVIWNLINGGKP
jgi:Mor family transcriptional regulator